MLLLCNGANLLLFFVILCCLRRIFSEVYLVFFTFQICFLNLSDLVINTCLTAICRSVILVDQKENLIFVT
jgi:hypothetical protein